MPETTTFGTQTLTNDKEILRSSILRVDSTLIVQMPLSKLYPPEFNPFQILDDAAMQSLMRSVRKYGVREPGLARPKAGGGYELLVGNRRKRACQLAGLVTMPVIIRELDDDLAAVVMVDSNLEQRDKILFSEKAWAYRIKLEALNYKGVKGDMLSVDILVEQTGESKNQIFRIIRLTELIINLLDKVDTKQLAFNPAVELSYLSQKQQMLVVSAMERYEVKPSLFQALRLKKMKQAGQLSDAAIDTILAQEKKPHKNEQTESTRYRTSSL